MARRGWKSGFLFLVYVVVLITWAIGPSRAYCDVEDPVDEGPPIPKSGWSTYIQGGALHQFDADMDDGSRFSVNRYFVQGGVSYAVDPRKSVSLSLGYGMDNYDFSGNGSFTLLDPWENVHSMRLSAPVRWGIDRQWTLFFVPTVRTASESGASFSDSVFGGGFAGFTYRINDRLTIGPGIGALRQIEDSSVFPILLIQWKITDELTLQTGRGLAATQGPGLMLNWAPNRTWSFEISGRYEKLRFRLDDDGPAPRGIGDDRAFPLLLGITYNFNQDAQVSLMGGVDLGGKLRLEDENGNLITEENHDPVPVLGMSFRFRF
jgi:hypothetical protein